MQTTAQGPLFSSAFWGFVGGGGNKSRWVEGENGQTCLLSAPAHSAARSERQAACQQPNQWKTFWNFSLHFRPFLRIRQFELLRAGCARYAHPAGLEAFLSTRKELKVLVFIFKPVWDYELKSRSSLFGGEVPRKHKTLLILDTQHTPEFENARKMI